MELAEAITAVCKGLRPEQAADRVGCGLGTLYAWRRGDTVPRSQAHVRNLIDMGVPAHLFASGKRPAPTTPVATPGLSVAV